MKIGRGFVAWIGFKLTLSNFIRNVKSGLNAGSIGSLVGSRLLRLGRTEVENKGISDGEFWVLNERVRKIFSGCQILRLSN